MKPPKLLPWIARRTGLHDELALKLWRRAAGEAEERVGNASSSEYFSTAINRFLALVEDESCAGDLGGDGQLGWFWRHQRIMAAHGLASSQASYRWWNKLCSDIAKTRLSV